MNVENDRLLFTTSSFRVEKESVLHKGVYTKEFAAMLLSSALSIFAYLAVSLKGKETGFVHFLMIGVLFVATFLLSRKFLFKEEEFLEAVFDKSDHTVRITRSGIFRKKTETIAWDKIHSVEIGNKKFVPENIDGIKFVQRISLQHGSYIPGLGDVEEFVTLLLKLIDGTERILYAGKIEEEPGLPLMDIKNFLGKT
jgi:hypothetical protein